MPRKYTEEGSIEVGGADLRKSQQSDLNPIPEARREDDETPGGKNQNQDYYSVPPFRGDDGSIQEMSPNFDQTRNEQEQLMRRGSSRNDGKGGFHDTSFGQINKNIKVQDQ